MKGIKGKIYRQNGIIIIAIVFILESIFLMGVRDYYYKSSEQELLNKAVISAGFYNKYLINEKIYSKARYILENESNDPDYYIQIFDQNAMMLTDSYGLKSEIPIESLDIVTALDGNIKAAETINGDKKEKLMAVSVPLYHQKNIAGALRYVVSIEEIENMVMKLSVIAMTIGLGVMILTFLLSSVLARGIVEPIEELTLIAERMAKGDFSKKAIKRNNDEIGKLLDTLNYMAEEIRKSNAVKNDFISSISHELRTPLTAVLGWTEILLEGVVDNKEEEREGIEIIASETKRLSEIVAQLLDFSKLESKKMMLNIKCFDMNELIKDVYKYFKKRFEKEGIEGHLILENEACNIHGDEDRLKQVLINIIDNAIKFSKDKGKIYISTSIRDESIQVKVKDEGLGIAEEDLKRVTEKFYKGKTGRGGSGIGLAISKEIIGLHKGLLKIDSIEKIGTTVTIELPRSKSHTL